MTKPEIGDNVQVLHPGYVEALSGEQHFLLAFEMSDLAHALIKEEIRRAHPAWSERRVFREFMKIAFSPDPLPVWLDEKLGPETDH